MKSWRHTCTKLKVAELTDTRSAGPSAGKRETPGAKEVEKEWVQQTFSPFLCYCFCVSYKHKNYNGRIPFVKELSIWLSSSVYGADLLSLGPIMMTTNSHCSLWLSLSFCVHCVSHHLLRWIEIMNTLWQIGAVLFHVYEILSRIRWTFAGSLLFNLHLCHGHMHLGIVALLNLSSSI